MSSAPALWLGTAAVFPAKFGGPLASRPGVKAPSRRGRGDNSCRQKTEREPRRRHIARTSAEPVCTQAEALTGGSIALAKHEIAAAPRDGNGRRSAARTSTSCLRRGRLFAPGPARRDVANARGRPVLVVTQRSPLEDTVSTASAKSRSKSGAQDSGGW